MNNTANWQNALDFFIFTFSELTVLFVIISLIVSIVNYYLPPDKIKSLLSGNRGYGVAMGLGSVTPFCSCSTIPMFIGLLKAKAAFGPLMAFLITSPLLNPFVISLFWIMFGPQVTLVYGISVITVASMSGVLLQHFRFDRFVRIETSQSCASSCNDSTNEEVANKSSCGSDSTCSGKEQDSQVGFFTLFKILGRDTIKQLWQLLPYMAIGVAVGAVLHGFVPVALFEELSGLNTFVLIPIAALLGIFLYVRASTMIPIAASLIAKGLSMGAVMSLTIAGAGASLPEMIMLKKLFHWPLLITFVLLVLLTACVTGTTIELLALH